MVKIEFCHLRIVKFFHLPYKIRLKRCPLSTPKGVDDIELHTGISSFDYVV